MTGMLVLVNIPKRNYESGLLNCASTANSIVGNEPKITKENKENSSPNSFRKEKDSTNKCKSSDCLNNNGVRIGLYRTTSENNIEGSDKHDSEVGKSIFKASWEELKEVWKPRRNKLRITRRINGIDLLNAFHWNTPLEVILSEVLSRLDVSNAVWNSTRNDKYWHVVFTLPSSSVCEELLQVLRTLGIGSRHGSTLSVIPCALHFDQGSQEPTVDEEIRSSPNSAWSRFSSSVRARNNLAQVLHDVRSEAALTFDWLFLLIVAAFVSAIGLVENSTVILVASMLISPLMGPITAGTLGTAVRDRTLQQMGVMHELLGLFLALVIGFLFGLGICAVDERYGVGDWPTYEMMSRCEIRSLWVGGLIAIPSGAGVALAVLGEYTASLVGVAISASLLPPAVNAGLLWAMSLVHYVFMNDDTRWTNVIKSSIYSSSQPVELAMLGLVSLCLTLVNILCIFLAGVVVYKVKEVFPIEQRDISWWTENRNFLRISKRCNNYESDPNVFSQWYATAEDKSNMSPVTDTSCLSRNEINLNQNDRISFRNAATHQNTRDFLQRNNCEKNQPMLNHQDDKQNDTHHMLPSSSNNSIDTNLPSYEDVNQKCSFANFGFEEESMDSSIATLEPSLSYSTFSDKRHYGVELKNKSFHV